MELMSTVSLMILIAVCSHKADDSSKMMICCKGFIISIPAPKSKHRQKHLINNGGSNANILIHNHKYET